MAVNVGSGKTAGRQTCCGHFTRILTAASPNEGCLAQVKRKSNSSRIHPPFRRWFCSAWSFITWICQVCAVQSLQHNIRYVFCSFLVPATNSVQVCDTKHKVRLSNTYNFQNVRTNIIHDNLINASTEYTSTYCLFLIPIVMLKTQTMQRFVVPKYVLRLFSRGAAAQRIPEPPHSLGFQTTHSGRATVGRTPLDEQSARRRDLNLMTHITQNKHPCSRWDSNPQSQQAKDRRTTPQTARPPGTANLGHRLETRMQDEFTV